MGMYHEDGYAAALADEHIREAEQEAEAAQEQRRLQWEALSAFITSEAEYAARDLHNQNDCGDALRRMEICAEARKAFMGEE